MNRSVILGLVAASLFAYTGYEGMAVLLRKAKEQDAATNVVTQWKAGYDALSKSREAWLKRYPDMGRFNDLLGLMRNVQLERYGLSADPDSLASLKVEDVERSGVNLGLTRVCVGSTSATDSAGLLVTASNYSSLLEGIERLAKRSDVEISSITVSSSESAAAQATLGGFCLLLRRGGAA